MRGSIGPRVFGIWTIESQRRRQVFDAFCQGDTLPEEMLPVFVPSLVAQLLLSLPVGGEASEKAHERTVRFLGATMFPGKGLPEHFCGHLQVVKRMTDWQIGLLP